MTGMGGGHHDRAVVEAFQRLLVHQGLIVAGLAVLVFVAWNVARSAQLRKAQMTGLTSGPGDADSNRLADPDDADGDHRPARTDAHPEAPARRLIRVAFGLLWVLDGVLQGQPSMPTSLVPQVIRPAAESSPVWVRDMVASASHVWTRHPVHAAAAAVWIQVGLGIWLLVARSGRWSDLAGAASATWAALIWVFGEAFGGVFGSGQSFLTGTPGAALLYAAAGALVAMPEAVWTTRRTGEVMLRTAGAFLIGMAVLQAWPGRGYWQGRTSGGGAGTLLGMVRDMSHTGQPALTASAVRSFASFDASHGWAVNLFVVVVLLATGAAFLSARLRPVTMALIASVVFALADWILVQDLGFFGGVGTDPNSMVPWVLLLVAGYVAFVRVPAAPPEPVRSHTGTAAPVGAAVATRTAPLTAGRRSWRLDMADDPARAVRIVGAVAALGVTLLGAGPMAYAALSSTF